MTPSLTTVYAVSDSDDPTALPGRARRRARSHPEAGSAYRFGSQQLNVHGPGVDAGTLVARPAFVPRGSDLCSFFPGRIHDTIAHLEAYNVEVQDGPIPRNGGKGLGMSIYFRDPDGSLLGSSPTTER